MRNLLRSVASILPDLDDTLRPDLASRVTTAKLLAVAACAVLLAIALLFWLFQRRAATSGRKWLARSLSLFIALTLTPIAAGAGLLGYMRWIEPNWISVDHVIIHSPVLAPALNRLRLVQITDLHVEETKTSLWSVQLAVEIINGLHPDAIFITGDFLSVRGGMEECLKALDSLHRPPFGIWAIPGNTDEIFYSEEELPPLCKEHGITMLINEKRNLTWGDRAPFCLAGVNDPTYGRDDLSMTLDGVPIPLPVLLLGHSPSERIITDAVQRRVALLLVGHTHGGQIGIDRLRRLSPYADRTPYIRGLYYVQGLPLYVNRGIGTKTREIRLLCRPEITLLEVKR